MEQSGAPVLTHRGAAHYTAHYTAHHATTTPPAAPTQPYAVARSVPGPVRPVPGASVVNAPVLSAPMVTASMSSASMTPAPVIMAASVA